MKSIYYVIIKKTKRKEWKKVGKRSELFLSESLYTVEEYFEEKLKAVTSVIVQFQTADVVLLFGIDLVGWA